MGGRLLEWAMASRAVVLLLVASLAYFGGYAFLHVNVEAYPDPAPAIIEVIAQYPGASAEEVERLVTIPLEVALAGMPGYRPRAPSRCSACRTCATSSTTASITRRPSRRSSTGSSR